MSRHDAAYVAHQIGKTENWLKRHAQSLPHSRAGKTYFWTDEDLRDLFNALRQRPDSVNEDGELRPVGSRRAS